jgi:DNA polymerase-3 subunit epsilon
VNGITDDMVAGKPLIHTLLASFAEFCGDDLMIAHNAPFDAQFLISDIKRHETVAPLGLVIDTLPIARKVFPGLANYKLGTLVQHLKIPTTGFHRAEEDATYCGHLFAQMVKRISIGGQPPKHDNLVALTGKPELRFPKIVRMPKQMDLFGSL